MGPIVSQSNTAADALTGAGSLRNRAEGASEGRCGYGPRIPVLVISPYAKANFVDHSVTDFTSILRFIEDNWSLGRIGNRSFDALAGSLQNTFDFSMAKNSKLCLDPKTGEPIACL
jgi:phospholipase C